MPVQKSALGHRVMVVAALLASMMSVPARANTIVCTAKIAGVGISPSGTVTLNIVGMGYPYMCNVNAPMSTPQGAISVALCQAWLSEFLTAKASGQNFSFWLDYGASTAPACTALTNFSWQVPTVFPYYMSFEG